MALAPAITEAMVDTAFRATAALGRSPVAMGFRKGEYVVYPTHGVGRVDKVGVEDVAGHLLNLIQISFAENRMVLRVPLAKARMSGLRELATAEAFADVLVTLAGRPRQSRLLWAKRAQAYQIRINSGDIHVLAEVVRDLQTAPGGSTASFSQRNLFELALDRLATEFAAVARTDKATAVERLMQAMQQSPGAEPLEPIEAPEQADPIAPDLIPQVA